MASLRNSEIAGASHRSSSDRTVILWSDRLRQVIRAKYALDVIYITGQHIAHSFTPEYNSNYPALNMRSMDFLCRDRVSIVTIRGTAWTKWM